ncbi:hypothetical protein QFC19_004500 [Naganishia cerealis]|uniref:Uncharacterized protein n=1 Tax=Naganishia cerealis TaxID=610337 RepID=A0ACC2VVA9_9TREE|nr:hypothetical protein QFC19_004500 [Naganishia cerealis]
MRTTSLATVLAIISLGAAPIAATGHPSPSAAHRRSQRRSPSNFFANLWERRLPITATTTVTVEATSTQVLWVTATSYPGSEAPTGVPTKNATVDPSLPATADLNSTTVTVTSSFISAVQTEGNYTTASEWWATNSQSGRSSSSGPTATPNATRTEQWIHIPTDAPSTDNATTSSHHYDGSSAANDMTSDPVYTTTWSSFAPNFTDVSSATLGWNETTSVVVTSYAASSTASSYGSPVLGSAVEYTVNSTSVTQIASASQSDETTESSVPATSSLGSSSASNTISATQYSKTPKSTGASATSQEFDGRSFSDLYFRSFFRNPCLFPDDREYISDRDIYRIVNSADPITIDSTTSKAATPSATLGSSLTTTPLNDRLVAAYYPDWSVWTFPPSNLDFNRLDVVDFAFAIVNAQYGLEFTQYNSEDTLNWLVSVAHAAGKKVRLSVGGWTGSVYFSPAVATEANRQTLAQAMLSMYNKFNLDGIDIDWEYPGVMGADTNIVSSDDSANYLTFLKLLRKTLPPTAILSAATQVWPFAGSNGAPLADVSEFAKLLDWVMIMNYDIWSSSSTPGPNAPLSNGCGNSAQPLANAYAAVSSWTTAKMPAKQIMLGLPAYGYIQVSTADSLRARKRRGLEKKGGATLYNADGGTSYGQIKFSDIVAQGGLTKDADEHWVGANGFTRHWDTCSSTVSLPLLPT